MHGLSQQDSIIALEVMVRRQPYGSDVEISEESDEGKEQVSEHCKSWTSYQAVSRARELELGIVVKQPIEPVVESSVGVHSLTPEHQGANVIESVSVENTFDYLGNMYMGDGELIGLAHRI